MHWHFITFCLILAIQVQTVTCAKGSTKHLRDIVFGRCWYYKQFKHGVSGSTNCTALWDAFRMGFAYKDPCNLTFNDYKPFFDQLKGGDIVDKSLFWSGTYKAVHSYSDFDLRFTTLEDTLEGYMVNELNWCGNSSLSRNTSDGIDYKFCPNRSSSCDLITPFWGQASKKFAERARGVVRVMVNGSRQSDQGDPIAAYSRSSFFGKYELPSFKVPTISRLEVLVVHTIGKKEREKCNTESIKLLMKDAKLRGLKVVCYDDPDDVRHILCTDHPNAKQCRFKGLLGDGQDYRQWKTIGITLAVVSSVLLIVVTIILAIYVHKVHCGKKADDTLVLTRNA